MITRLSDLVNRYFAAADDTPKPITTYSSDTEQLEVELVVDGDDYFTQVYSAIAATGPGDAVLIVGWTFLTSMRKGTSAEIGDLLAARRTAGVAVHLVLNGSLFANAPGTPFGQSLDALFDLRDVRGRPAGALVGPLDQHVLFDFSGSAAGFGSHHQKVVVVKRGTDVVAWVGGIDFWPDRDDDSDHDTLRKDGGPWGWHDIAIRLRGRSVTEVWANFVSRYEETRTLPARNAMRYAPGGWVPSRPYNPVPGATLPAPPTAFPVVTPTPRVALQVLRSRYPVKLPRERPPLLWAHPPTGPIHQVFATLRKAIAAAQRYIYVEDQFLKDTLEGDGAAAPYSILGDFRAAAARGVKVIFVTSGKADTATPAPNSWPTRSIQTEVIDRLPPADRANVAIWKLTDLMVHSKFILIDDEFGAVGSANLQSRSQYGIDQELHVAVVDATLDGFTPAGVVRDWRVRLWTEHLDVLHSHAAYLDELRDLDLALGMWRRSWRVGGTSGMWFSTNNPPGFLPDRVRRTFVGPLPGP